MRIRSLLCVLALVVLASGGAAYAGDGLVALQTAEPSCGHFIGRYVNCDNGTVTDNHTGLVWLANASCFGKLDWFEAMAAVAGLSDLPDHGKACINLTRNECDCGLSDGSSPGEWRLPTIEEWEVMVEHADDVLGCSPTITNDAGSGCWSAGWPGGPSACSFYGVQSSYYWSSSSFLRLPAFAWIVDLDGGNISAPDKGFLNYVWPVRGGQ